MIDRKILARTRLLFVFASVMTAYAVADVLSVFGTATFGSSCFTSCGAGGAIAVPATSAWGIVALAVVLWWGALKSLSASRK